MEWITKLKAASLSNADVSITKTAKSNKNKIRYALRFRNMSYAKITTTKKIVYALSGSKLYFKEGNEREGFSLNGFNIDNTACSTMFTLLNDEYCGDYKLEYDKAEKLYYIDTEKKIVR